MPDYKPILGTLTRPDTALPKHGRVCQRCGIEYPSPKGLTHCPDCRLVMRTPQQYRDRRKKKTA